MERIKRWGLRGGMAILDQGVYSGANFLVSILLARWITPEMYGGFSAAYSVFLLISNLQVALIAEPMSIFGANKYQRNVVSYIDYLLRIQWIGALVSSLILLGISIYIKNTVVRDGIIAMSTALPFILFYWYVRRSFYLEMQPGKAFLASLIYSLMLVSLVSISRSMGMLTMSTAYLFMAISSLVASFFALRQLGVRFWGRAATEPEIDSRAVRKELWDFGKWILPAYLAGWLTSFSFPLVISIFLNTELAGVFRAFQNLFLPFQQLLASVTLLFLPWLARQNSEHGKFRLFWATEVIAGITGIVAVIYSVFLILFRHEIVAMLYASAFYSKFDVLVIFLALATFLGAIPLILGLALRILNFPRAILSSKGWAALLTFFIGFPMIWMYGMNGVVISLLVGVLIEIVILVTSYLKVKKKSNFIALGTSS